MARIEKMREEWRDRAEFVYVYIKEAHPADEWQVKSNLEKGVIHNQPNSMAERMQLANAFITEMKVETTTLVDDIQNTANACYAAWPERIYVVDPGGKIVYKGGMGPFFFKPEEVERFLVSRYGSGRPT